MKCKLWVANVIGAGLLLAVPAVASGAEDGAALYKTKCAGCHGPSGEGKPAMKAPALKGTSLTAEQITQHLTKGEATSKAPHNKGITGLNDAQAKAIADFVKTLK
jgi:mono/diheme cytochrome c family protein